VDLYKIGRLNHHPLGETIDWCRFGLDAVAKCESLGNLYYVKHDLAAAMPRNSLGPHHRTAQQIEAMAPAMPTIAPRQAILL
jgi:hypothetical protein